MRSERLVPGAILPGVGLFRELQAEVKRLTQRVEELEAKLQSGNAGTESPAPVPATAPAVETSQE
jgi:cell division septum initiation protein DivIVA